eukprot:369261-Amphidinium_carterae.1
MSATQPQKQDQSSGFGISLNQIWARSEHKASLGQDDPYHVLGFVDLEASLSPLVEVMKRPY